MGFRRKPGFTSSRPKMFMFGITTFMFALGIIALVIVVALGFPEVQVQLGFTHTSTLNSWSYRRWNDVWATTTRLMVRSHDFHAVSLTRLKAVQYILCDV